MWKIVFEAIKKMYSALNAGQKASCLGTIGCTLFLCLSIWSCSKERFYRIFARDKTGMGLLLLVCVSL